jgi:hypothetical protein
MVFGERLHVTSRSQTTTSSTYKRMNDYFLYVDYERATTSPTTGLHSDRYSLKQMFMFISCIIMNIIIFNSGLNIHTCIWIVSLTTLVKCLLNYEIKICQNVACHLTTAAALSISQVVVAHFFWFVEYNSYVRQLLTCRHLKGLTCYRYFA